MESASAPSEVAEPLIVRRRWPPEDAAGSGTDWTRLSVVEQAGALTNPVFLLVEPARTPAIDSSTGELRARLAAHGRTPEYLELDAGFGAALPASRAAVYRKIEEFLNGHLNSYTVTIAPTPEVK